MTAVRPPDDYQPYSARKPYVVTVDDLNASLDGPLLVQVWPSLWLPPRLRHLWEQRFPQLAASRGADAA